MFTYFIKPLLVSLELYVCFPAVRNTQRIVERSGKTHLSSMSLQPEDREPGVPMDNSKEDVGGSSCTGDYSKHVSYQADQYYIVFVVFKMTCLLSCFNKQSVYIC